MKQYVAIKTCYWGPTPGTQTLYVKDAVILAHGNEPNLDEFFRPLDGEKPAAPKAKPGPKPKKAQTEDLNDL